VRVWRLCAYHLHTVDTHYTQTTSQPDPPQITMLHNKTSSLMLKKKHPHLFKKINFLKNKFWSIDQAKY